MRQEFKLQLSKQKDASPVQFAPSGPSTPPAFTPGEDSKKVRLEEDDESKTTNIGKNLNQAQQDALIKFLVKNQDIFAWKPSNMLGIPREITKHSLRIKADAKPVK